MLFVIIATILLAAFAVGQTVHTFQVGPNGDVIFVPRNLNASNGDIIQFVFLTAGHSVTQSTFADPCTALEGGFSSGFARTSGEVWNLTLSDTSNPIWFFCAQTWDTHHCKNGMVGAINSPLGAIDAFIAGAMTGTSSPSVTAVALSGIGAVATASPINAPFVGDASTLDFLSSTFAEFTATATSSSSHNIAGSKVIWTTFLVLFGSLLPELLRFVSL